MNLDHKLGNCEYNDHAFCGTVSWTHATDELSRLFRVLAIEGYIELISWSRNRSSWNTNMELEVVRIASFCGHRDVVEDFLDYSSSDVNLLYVAMIGAAEAGNDTDLLLYMGRSHGKLPSDPLLDSFDETLDLVPEKHVASSLVGSLVFAILSGSGHRPEEYEANVNISHQRVMKRLVECSYVDARQILQASSIVMQVAETVQFYERCTMFLMHLIDNYRLDFWKCQIEINRICEAYIRYFGFTRCAEELHDCAIGWFQFVTRLGFDIQSLNGCFPSYHTSTKEVFAAVFEPLKASQLASWSQYDLIIKGRELMEIQQAVNDGRIKLNLRYRQGLLLTHLSAAYNLLDVLKWLVTDLALPLDAHDGLGRTVLDVALVMPSV